MLVRANVCCALPPSIRCSACTSGSPAGCANQRRNGTSNSGVSIRASTFVFRSTRSAAYSDFLTHDIGSGDGIPILPTAEYAHTAPLMRTAPLWGLRTRNRLMHDGLSFTLEEAIRRHRGQADDVRLNYEALSSSEKLALIAFLNSL